MEKALPTLAALTEEATRFVKTLSPVPSGATLVTLSGELGAGKTAFVKAAAQALGIDDTLTSPTFVLEKVYALPLDTAFKRLVHIDAYRLKQGSDLTPLAFSELMRDPATLIMLEWPERVRDALPAAHYALSLVAHDDGSRTLTYGT